MITCEGLSDWLLCLRCEHICTYKCPLEGDDVVAELAVRLRASERDRDVANN